MPARFLHRFALILSASACLLLPATITHAQTAAPAPSADKQTTAADIAGSEIKLNADTQERLRQTVDAIDRQQKQLDRLRQRRSALPEGKSDPELDKSITDEQQQLDDVRQQFIEIATSDYDLLHNDEPQQLDVNLQQEMLLIVYPLLREMKQLSERPRAIEKLSAQIAFYQQRNDALDKGLTHLRDVIKTTNDRKLLQPLRALEASATEAQTEMQQKLDSLQRRYSDLRDESPPLWSSIGRAMGAFATGMGLHLLLALVLALATFFSVILLARLPLRFLEKRRIASYTMIERTVLFFSRAIGILLFAIIFLMVLYSLNEWVLLGIAAIIFIGMFFGLKNMMPNYLSEIRTVLNWGSVRQGERLIYNGLPWRIADLDFYTVLHNPALSGLVRVPLTQISKLSSRPFHKDEPWFPTKVGDFVLMSDGLQGRVERQTPEIVQINAGESLISYRTEKFLDARPQNMSTGFVVSTIFGIDYQHQRDVLTVIEKQFQEALQQALAQEDFSEHCLHIGVEYKGAAASSLDFRLLGLFKGEAAENHGRIQRWLQRTALECANTNGWEIPFQQIRIHTDITPALDA